MGVYDQSKIGNAPSRGGSGGGVLKPPGYHASTVVRRGLGLPSSPMLGLGSDTVRLPLESERWLAKPPPALSPRLPRTGRNWGPPPAPPPVLHSNTRLPPDSSSPRLVVCCVECVACVHGGGVAGQGVAGQHR